MFARSVAVSSNFKEWVHTTGSSKDAMDLTGELSAAR